MARLSECMQQKKFCFLLCLFLCAVGGLVLLSTFNGRIKHTLNQTVSTYSKRNFLTRKLTGAGSNASLTNIGAGSYESNSNITGRDEDDADFSQAPELSPERLDIEERKYRHEDNSRYQKCPTSWRKRAQSDDVFSKKYLPDVPLLMWNEHFNASEYRRLSQFHMVYGWKTINHTDVRAALEQMNSPKSRYMFDERLVNGKVPDGQCIRCAVIGNGGILNGSKMGKEIDGHDYIFRVNHAVTKDHEEDVGSRTSIYCFTMITLHNTLAGRGFQIPKGDENMKYMFFADSEWTYTYLAAALSGNTLPKSRGKYNRGPMTFPRKLTAENVKIVHPDFERYIKWSWVNSPAQRRSIYRPTTGGIMVLAALHACDEVSLYGFAGDREKFTDHYYDKTFHKQVYYANHDHVAENKLWQLMDQHGIIKLYKRDVK